MNQFFYLSFLLSISLFSFSSLGGEIHDFARAGQTEEVIFLLDQGLGSIHEIDENGETLRQIATRTNNVRLLEYLFWHNTNPWGASEDEALFGESNSGSTLNYDLLDTFFSFSDGENVMVRTNA